MSLLDVNNLCVRYGDRAVVENLSFSVEQGDSLGLVGESGSGKTQTALAILGLLPDNATVTGSIRLGGTQMVAAPEPTLNAVRARRAAMIFQDPLQALNPYVRIGKQLRRILEIHRLATGAAADARVLDMLRAVGLPDAQRQSRAFVHELSGGMRQRVMIASALITEPDLLIADEPTTALDVTVQAQILELLDRLRQQTALLLITHDLGVVAGHCERVLLLERGTFVEAGATRQVFAMPKAHYTRLLLDAVPDIERAPGLGTPGDPVLLSADGLAVSFREAGHGDLHAVKGVDLDIKSGETVAIVGESGSGKSSLVRALLGLVPAHAGTVSFAGVALPAALRSRTRAVRRDLQLVFQDPLGSLDPQFSVRDIVAEPLIVHEPGLDGRGRHERVLARLLEVGLGEEFAGRYPHELSGGQAQRVAIARALIVEPQVLVCDEAVAALDGTVRQQILVLLREIQERTKLAIVFISHDLGVVRAVSHRVIVMYLGRIVEVAGNADLFSAPRHPYTRALLDAVPTIAAGQRPKRAALAGEVPSTLNPPPGCEFHPRCPYAEARCGTERPLRRSVGRSSVACLRATEIASLLQRTAPGVVTSPGAE